VSDRRRGMWEGPVWTWGVGLFSGLVLGVALGVSMENIGAGIGIGLALGIALSLSFAEAEKARRAKDGEQEHPPSDPPA
jgi:hypothetical protein